MMNDPHHLRADIILISSSIRKGWQVPAARIADTRDKAIAIVNDSTDQRLKARALEFIELLKKHSGDDPNRN